MGAVTLAGDLVFGVHGERAGPRLRKKPVQSVSDEDISVTLPHLSPQDVDIVRTRRLIGCRPEVQNIRRLRHSGGIAAHRLLELPGIRSYNEGESRAEALLFTLSSQQGAGHERAP